MPRDGAIIFGDLIGTGRHDGVARRRLAPDVTPRSRLEPTPHSRDHRGLARQGGGVVGGGVVGPAAGAPPRPAPGRRSANRVTLRSFARKASPAPDLAAPQPRLPWQEIDIFRPICGLQVLAVVRSEGG